MRGKKITSTCLSIILILNIIGILGNEIGFSSRLDINTRNSSALARSNAAAPEIDIATWTLSINGSVSTPLNLTYVELKVLPAVTIFAELICYPSSFITKGNWTGVQLSYLLTLAEVKPEAFDMVFYAVDGFSSSLPVLEIQQRPDMLLAYEKNGVPLFKSDYYPVMVVAPGQGGYKWVKNVTHIKLVDHDYKGNFERVGYPDDAVLPNYNLTVPVPIISTIPGEGEMTTVSEFYFTLSIILILAGICFISIKKSGYYGDYNEE